jgi:hypothetical protein
MARARLENGPAAAGMPPPGSEKPFVNARKTPHGSLDAAETFCVFYCQNFILRASVNDIVCGSRVLNPMR